MEQFTTSVQAPGRRAFWLVVLGAAGVLTFLHLWQLGTYPGGVFIDEASIGYNAWSLAETGRDEHGVRYPFFARCFGNHQDPVMIYSLAALLKLVPLSLFVVRLPSALYHLLAAAAFGFLVYEYTRRRWWALGGAVSFGLLPWSFLLSRSAFSGYTPYLLGVIVGWYGLLRAARRRSWQWAVVAAVGWTFAMHSHNVARPYVVPLLLAFVITFWRPVRRRWRTALVFAALLIVLMLPMTLIVLQQHAALTERFATLAVWSDGAPPGVVLTRIAYRYALYLSPHFLLTSGDPVPRHHSGFGGVLFAFLAPLLVAGLWLCVRRWRHPYYRFLLAAFLLFPLPASLTMDLYHSTRSVGGAVPVCLLAMVGGAWLLRMGPRWRLAVRLLLVLGALNIGAYMVHYFSPAYQEKARPWYHEPLTTGLRAAVGHNATEPLPLLISPTAFPMRVSSDFQPYMYATLLFVHRVDPARYQHEGLPPARLQPYLGSSTGPALLLRANILHRHLDGRDYLLATPEPLPANAELLESWPLTDHYLRFQAPGAAMAAGLTPAMQLFYLPPPLKATP